MITTHKNNLVARCKQRGYTLAEVMPCVVSQDNDQWTIDELHPAYPRTSKPVRRMPAVPQPAPSSGPGTELKALLKKVGITASPTCSCNARARRMDEMEAREPGWCAAHLEEIVGWLREEAEKRGLPFFDIAGRMLVKRAIHNAQKSEARRAKKPPLTE
jgi:hypothetical protein